MRQILKNNVSFLLIIFVVTVIAYSPILKASFVSADDLQGYVNNPIVRDFGQTVKHGDLLMYYAVMYKLFGLYAPGLHISALIVHLINITLAFVLIYMLFGKKVAAIATPLFALHPAISEAVFWISAISYPMLFTFSFLTFIFFVSYRKNNIKLHFGLSILSYIVLIVFVRNPWVIVTLPILVLIDYFYLPKPNIKNYVAFIPLIIIYLAIVVIPNTNHRVQALAGFYTESQGIQTPWLLRVPVSIYKPTALYIWPQKLSIFHIEPMPTGKYIFVVVTAVAVLGATGVLFFKNRKYAGLLLIILASLAASYSPIQIGWISAERYMYLGAPFFTTIVALLLLASTKNEKTIINITILLALLLGIRTYIRGTDWTSNLNLWLSTQKTTPSSTRVYNNLGDAFGNAGRQDLAIQAFATAIKIDPNYADATHNLGNTYLQIGDLENAKLYLQKSFELNPMLYQSTYKLGLIAAKEGNLELAKQYFEQTLQIYPDYQPAKEALQSLQ